MKAITWRYSDGSNAGLVGVYGDEATADEVMRLLAEHGDTVKVFELHDSATAAQLWNLSGASGG